MRDTEISRLRRSYARSEVSRWEMKRSLDALAVQLRLAYLSYVGMGVSGHWGLL